MRILVLISLILTCTQFLIAQISFAPSFVFVDEHSGIGNIYISNRSDYAQEIIISFQFGYPDTDSAGNFQMNYTDTVAKVAFGLDGMVRAFPKAFVLEPGSQRTVRLQVMPKNRLEDGMYFTRMVVFSKELKQFQTVESENITPQLGIQYEQITGVFYKKGKVNTGLIVKNYETRQTADVFETQLQMSRNGNAPFIGSVSQKLYADDGKLVASNQTTTTVYFDVVQKLQLPVKEILTSFYELEVSFETKRRDMSSLDLVQAKPFVIRIPVEIKDILEILVLETEESDLLSGHKE